MKNRAGQCGVAEQKTGVRSVGSDPTETGRRTRANKFGVRLT